MPTNQPASFARKRLPNYCFLFVALLLLGGCQEIDKKLKQSTNYLPESVGSIDEVILVMEENKWQGSLGEKIREVFRTDYNILPQREPIFDLRQVKGADMVNLLQRGATIFVVGLLDANNSTSRLIKKQIKRFKAEGREVPPYFTLKNIWAQPQRVIYLYGENQADLLEKIDLYKDKLKRRLYELNDNKAKRNFVFGGLSDTYTAMVKDQFHVNMPIPRGFKAAHEETDFLWLRKDDQATESVINLMFHRASYADSIPITISGAYPITVRDGMGKIVTSDVKGSYMYSDPVIPFAQTYINMKDGTQALETRGLWRLKKDFMGGPFLTIAFDNPKRKEVITVDAFVYAPKIDKRQLVRLVEVWMRNGSLL